MLVSMETCLTGDQPVYRRQFRIWRRKLLLEALTFIQDKQEGQRREKHKHHQRCRECNNRKVELKARSLNCREEGKSRGDYLSWIEHSPKPYAPSCHPEKSVARQ